jgi:hypothetical protein
LVAGSYLHPCPDGKMFPQASRELGIQCPLKIKISFGFLKTLE